MMMTLSKDEKSKVYLNKEIKSSLIFVDDEQKKPY